MPLNLSQAARLAGRSRNTLIRAIKSGKLKAPRGENGDYAIDEVELTKVFPPTGPSSDVLEAEVERLRAQIEELRSTRDDARRERDEWKAEAAAWRAQAERLTKSAQ